MSKQESKRFLVRAKGPLACFTRPEMKVERVSYEVMTPSAARGLLEAILWKPAILWRIHEIAVLAPIAWTSFRRNEVNGRASPKGAGTIVADEDRAQRNTVALTNVDYRIAASFEMTESAGPEDNLRKFEEMFERRLAKGQCFQQPYLPSPRTPARGCSARRDGCGASRSCARNAAFVGRRGRSRASVARRASCLRGGRGRAARGARAGCRMRRGPAPSRL
jgi:CRISPR-associated protein Cas5d